MIAVNLMIESESLSERDHERFFSSSPIRLFTSLIICFPCKNSIVSLSALHHSVNDLPSNINHQRRCSSTQSFLIHPNNHHNNTLHSSIRRHRFHSSIIPSPYLSQQQSTDQQTSLLNDHVLITEFGAI